MRVATWNLRAGGGARIRQITEVLLQERPDVLVLTEFRSTAGPALLAGLAELEYNVLSARPLSGVEAVNTVCLLTRSPAVPKRVVKMPASRQRWVCAHLPVQDWTVLGVHVPNQHEVWNKRDFLVAVEAFAARTCRRHALILGDLNTALDEDCEGSPIREAVTMKGMLGLGWVDAWRASNPDAREFSWYSHRSNGFRIDHCLVSPSLAARVNASRYRHDVRTGRISDHSLLLVDLI